LQRVALPSQISALRFDSFALIAMPHFAAA
jgi:hypothetical protein